MSHKKFQELVFSFYREHGRIFPWRKTRDPYSILISEIMLQQTQTDRVIPKYEQWLELFPTFEALASAKLQQVLTAWQGLGYNSRALRLKKLAETVVEKYSSKLPYTYEELLELPGIGPYTAGAVMAFAYNKPFPIIETNIRTAFIFHYFSKDHGQIHDQEIIELIRKTLDHENPREWYWALMDYGAYLKKIHGNLNTRSRHYTKQSKFIGSNRHIRSSILKKITEKPSSLQDLKKFLKNQNVMATAKQISKNIQDLADEGFIKRYKQHWKIV